MNGRRGVVLSATALLLSTASLAGAAKAPVHDAIPRVPSPERIAAAAASARSFHAVGGRWLVVATPGAASRQIAADFGAEPVAPALGISRVSSRGRAQALAERLQSRGLYRFMEPDVPVARASDPAEGADWWRPMLLPPSAAPTAPWGGPTVAVIESGVDRTHPDLAGPNVSVSGFNDPTDRHGTAVAALIAAPQNGVGVAGLWPQGKTRVYTQDGSCSSVVAALYRAIADRVDVVNMSYSFPYNGCASHLVATQYAYGFGVVLVAAAGNYYDVGNPLLRPANDPHVLTVGSVDQNLDSSSFSNENTGIDLVAPGEGITSAIPVALDTEDGDQDGYTVADGTSFAAPLVTSATGWLRAAKPWLTASQASELIRRQAIDLGDPGWDESFGFGLLNLNGALRATPPPDDPWEPNDDIEWIDGRRFAADPPFLRTKARANFVARLDRDEDPVDVYRVAVAARSRLTITVRINDLADVDLAAYRRPLGSVFGWRAPYQLIGASRRANNSPERLVIVNRGSTRRVIYVATWVANESTDLDSTYRLIMIRGRLP